jgi:hypothetical protein
MSVLKYNARDPCDEPDPERPSIWVTERRWPGCFEFGPQASGLKPKLLNLLFVRLTQSLFSSPPSGPLARAHSAPR